MYLGLHILVSTHVTECKGLCVYIYIYKCKCKGLGPRLIQLMHRESFGPLGHCGWTRRWGCDLILVHWQPPPACVEREIRFFMFSKQNPRMIIWPPLPYCSKTDLCSDSNILTVWDVNKKLKISSFHTFYVYDTFSKYFIWFKIHFFKGMYM